MKKEAIVTKLEKELDVSKDFFGIIKQIARTFEQNIFSSAQASEIDKPRLTTYAVENLIEALRNVDLEISNDKNLAENLRKIFRLELQTLRLYGTLWNHALMKPHGYPGDFEILNAIYRNTLRAQDPVGRELDRAFLMSPLAEAVRSRKDTVVASLYANIQSMVKENVKILNLACGPCTDVIELLNTDLSPSVSILCVDQDKEALDFAKSMMGQKVFNHNILYLQANVLRLKRLPNLEIAAPFDIIYSVGLFDYIPDRLVFIVLQNYWQMLTSGGLLLITIKDRDRYDPTFYDWMADWTFIPRTEKQFTALLSETLKISQSKIKLERDRTGITIIAMIKKAK